MKTLIFIVLLAFSANAFNFTTYLLGADEVYGFNQSLTQDGVVCSGALSADINNIIQLIETKNFDQIALYLGSYIEHIKTDLQTTCLPYFAGYGDYVYRQTGNTDFKQVIEENFHQYYPQIIQLAAEEFNLIGDGQDYQAGQTHADIAQILFGIVKPATPTEPTFDPTQAVPFNHSKFFTDYYGTLFQALGIQAPINVSALIECSYVTQNVTDSTIYVKEQFSTLDFEQKLDAIQYLISLGFAAIRGCEDIAPSVAPIFVPIAEAFLRDPTGFTLEVSDRIALDLPEYIASIKQEIVDIQEGDYAQAGELKAQRVINDFGGIVSFNNSGWSA